MGAFTVTAYSLAIVHGKCASFVSIARRGTTDEYAVIDLSTRSVQPLDLTDEVVSQRNLVHGLKLKGSFRATGSIVSLAGVELEDHSRYANIFEFIDRAAVGKNYSDAQKTAIKDGLARYYGWGK